MGIEFYSVKGEKIPELLCYNVNIVETVIIFHTNLLS